MRSIRWWDHLTINTYWLGLNVISGSLTPLILPLLVEHFVGPDLVPIWGGIWWGKNTAYGLLRSAGLLMAILVQPLGGLLSDRNTSRFGRRRPYIFGGVMMTLVCLAGVALAPNYWWLFGIILVQQAASNIAHGALQGLIPDLVPPAQRGVSSGIKTILEIPIPSIFVGLVIAKMISPTNVWPAMLIIMTVVFVTMLITMLAPERPLSDEERPTESLRGPIVRLVLLTLIFGGVTVVFGGSVVVVGNLLTGQGWAQLVAVGLAGLVAMAASIIVGVWFSARVGIGPAVRRNPSFTWWVVNRLLFLAAVGSIQSFALYFLQDVVQVPNAADTTGSMMMAVGIFILVAGLGSGFLSDRIGERLLVALSGLLAAGGVAVLFLGTTTMVYVAGSIIGIATGLFFTTNWSLGTKLVPPEKAGLYLGVSNLAGAGAGVVGAGIGGPLADFFNQVSPGLGYLAIFAMYGAIFVLSALTLLRVRVPAAQATTGG